MVDNGINQRNVDEWKQETYVLNMDKEEEYERSTIMYTTVEKERANNLGKGSKGNNKVNERAAKSVAKIKSVQTEIKSKETQDGKEKSKKNTKEEMKEEEREIEKENKAEQSFIFYKKKRKNKRKTNGKETKRKAQDQNDMKNIEGAKREKDRHQKKKNTGKQ